MAEDLSGKKIAFLVANEGAEQVELTRPWDAVKAAGGQPVLAAPQEGEIQAFNHLDKGDTFKVDVTTGQLTADDYEGIVLPGGVSSPDQLRMDEAADRFVLNFFAAGKPAAAICHGAWTLVETGVLEGRTVTSWPRLKTDIRTPGGIWVDGDVVVCTNGPNTLVTSRKPDDLDAFCVKLVEAFAKGSLAEAA